jgi:hypothetical protein
MASTVPSTSFRPPDLPKESGDLLGWAAGLTSALTTHFRQLLALPAGALEDGQLLTRQAKLVTGSSPVVLMMKWS